MIKGGVLMYEDEWREYYATKNESIHITRNKLIFQCNEGIALSTHKTEIERTMHALALKLLLLELNSYDFLICKKVYSTVAYTRKYNKRRIVFLCTLIIYSTKELSWLSRE